MCAFSYFAAKKGGRMKKLKKMLSYAFKVPMFIVLLFVVIIYGLPALGKDAEVDEYAIVTAIGLDKGSDDVVDVSLLTFVPVAEQNFAEKYKVVKASGESVLEAIDYAGLYLGREVGLNHVKTVVISEDYFNDNASVEMDYLTRNKSLALSTSIICTDAKASDFLETVQKMNTESSIKVDDIINFNNKYIYSTESTFETFYKGLYSKTKSTLVPFISLSENTDEGVTVAAGEASGGSGEEEKVEKTILNDGNALLCKNGSKVAFLDNTDMQKLNLATGKFKSGTIVIDNFTDDVFRNARLTFDIQNSTIRRNAKFYNGVPVVNMSINFYVKLLEAKEEDLEIKENLDVKNISKEAISALENKIRSSISDAIGILRENKCDILRVYTLLNNSFPSETKKFMESLDDEQDFLNHVIFKVSPNIYAA